MAPPATIGPYHVRDVVLAGALATTYRVQRAPSAPYQLLTSLPLDHWSHEAAAAYVDEIVAIDRAALPGFTRLRGAVASADAAYFVTEMPPGEPLRPAKRPRPRRRPPAMMEAMGATLTAYALASAVEALHAIGRVHGALAPEMIYREPDRFAPVHVALAGFLHGSAHYLAPEQCSGDRSLVTSKADVYALGCVFFELVTGRPRFLGDEASVAIQHRDVSAPHAGSFGGPVRATFEALIAAMLLKAPCDRPDLATVCRWIREPHELLAHPPLGGHVTSDTVEVALLDRLRAVPSDPTAREVYGDWLEQQGRGAAAITVRTAGELEAADRDAVARETTTAFRALVTRVPVARCLANELTCPKRWNDLAPMPTSTGVRHCGACDQPVYFCTSLAEAAYRGSLRQCIAIDAAVARGDAVARYDTAPRTPCAGCGALRGMEASAEPCRSCGFYPRPMMAGAMPAR